MIGTILAISGIACRIFYLWGRHDGYRTGRAEAHQPAPNEWDHV